MLILFAGWKTKMPDNTEIDLYLNYCFDNSSESLLGFTSTEQLL